MTRAGRRPRGGVDRGPRPVGDSLDEVVAGISPARARELEPRDARGRATPGEPTSVSSAALGTVFSRWEELVGPTVGRHTRPLRLEGRTLVVAVDQPPWATQIRVLSPGILARLAEDTGEPLDRLEVVVRPVR